MGEILSVRYWRRALTAPFILHLAHGPVLAPVDYPAMTWAAQDTMCMQVLAPCPTQQMLSLEHPPLCFVS